MSKDNKDGSAELVAAIRAQADGMRAGKAKLAKAFVKEATGVINDYGKTAWKFGRVAEALGKAGISTGNVFMTIGSEIKENTKLQEQASTFVANLIDNGAARIHELANIVESVAKQPAIRDAMTQAASATESFGEVMDEVISMATQAGRRKSSHLSVVEEATRKEKKSAATRRPKKKS